MAAYIAFYLANHGDDWYVIDRAAFLEQVDSYQTMELAVYNKPLGNDFVRDRVLKALETLRKDGFITVLMSGNFFATWKLLRFYRSYVNKASAK